MEGVYPFLSSPPSGSFPVFVFFFFLGRSPNPDSCPCPPLGIRQRSGCYGDLPPPLKGEHCAALFLNHIEPESCLLLRIPYPLHLLFFLLSWCTTTRLFFVKPCACPFHPGSPLMRKTTVRSSPEPPFPLDSPDFE